MASIGIEEDTGSFAVAEVTGYEPGDGSPNETNPIATALARNGVMCLRMPRPLIDEEMQSIVSIFGPIKDPVGRTKSGGVFRYSKMRQVIDSGFVMTDEIREQLGDLTFGGLDDERPGLFETYHCDDTYTERPAGATVLHARQLPASGGGPTCFLDMRAAYDLLDDETKRSIEGLTVTYAYNNEDAFPPRRAASGEAEALVEVSHPLVRTHAAAGTRALFIDLDRAKHIDEMQVPDGRALLQSLQDHAEANAPECRHHWQPNDVLVWDNASVQHKASGDFKVGESRRFWRYMVEGEHPI